MMSWDFVRIFLALHRAGSYDGVAQTLGIDASTARRKIQSFETDIGATLFQRSAGRLIVSPDRMSLLDAALAMENAAVQFADEAHTTQHEGPIRLSMLDIFGELLAPDIAAFSAAHRNICLDVTTEPHFVDLDRDNVDIAIRLARPVRGQHGLRRLAGVPFGIYGAQRYFAAQADRNTLDVLALWPHFSHKDHDFELADTRWFQSIPGEARIAARTDNYPMLLSLCEAGLGVAMLPCFLGRPHRDLRLLDDQRAALSIDAYLVVRKEAAKLAKIRSLIDFLVECFRALAPVLRGEAMRSPFPLQHPSPKQIEGCRIAKHVGRFALATPPLTS